MRDAYADAAAMPPAAQAADENTLRVTRYYAVAPVNMSPMAQEMSDGVQHRRLFSR